LRGDHAVSWVAQDEQVDHWGLPGHGVAKPDCGTFYTVGCLNVDEHFQEQLGSENSIVGKVYVKRKKVSCKDPTCPMCYETWASREARRIERRCSAYRLHGALPIHFVASVPHYLYDKNAEFLRSEAYSVSKKVGFLGGSCIYHPYREIEGTKLWYFSPHFHMIGFGWIKGSGQEYLSSGWICRNLGVRDSVYSTAFYQLSHCGVWYGPGRRHSVTWFGGLSYNKLKVAPEEKTQEVCPICGQDLVRLVWRGDGPIPIPEDVEGEYWLDPGGWLHTLYRGHVSYQNHCEDQGSLSFISGGQI
jgi:hypothetical protein